MPHTKVNYIASEPAVEPPGPRQSRSPLVGRKIVPPPTSYTFARFSL